MTQIQTLETQGLSSAIGNRKHPRLAPCGSQERRTALISAAVTGKIDVRQFAYQETP